MQEKISFGEWSDGCPAQDFYKDLYPEEIARRRKEEDGEQGRTRVYRGKMDAG
jgi:hypothetical protein